MMPSCISNREYGDHTGEKNFDDEDIIPIIEKVTGASLSDFFNRYVAGTEELPVREMLESIGLRLVVTPRVWSTSAEISDRRLEIGYRVQKRNRNFQWLAKG